MTPHNRGEKGDFAKIVLMPGDPLRAKFTADNFFEKPKLVTDVRNVLGYTGYYKGVRVSVMASGMGGPSAGIYSYELYTEYDVESIIRIGTSGGLQKELEVGELILALTCSTDSSYAHQYGLSGSFAPCCDYDMLKVASNIADKEKTKYRAGMVFSSDYFSQYNALGSDEWKKWARMGALTQDMETMSLYSNAMYLKKKALSILTVTDNVVTGKGFKDEERMEGNRKMIHLALETALELSNKK